MIGVLHLISAVLQLTVPSYAFRLVRRFGLPRVGWFIVIAFISLALLHLLGPMKLSGDAPPSSTTLNVLYAISSLLLLIGMGHVESICLERDRTRQRDAESREQWERQAREQISLLTRTNDELVREIAWREKIEAALQHSVAQYRTLFTENPQAMWVLDLRTCRFLEVNQAALRHYGFTADEFKARTGRDLVLPRAAAEFVRDGSKPRAGTESRSVWQHFRKDGTLMDVEITALDFQYGDIPARLILAEDITSRQRGELELRATQKFEAIGRVAAGVASHFNQLHSLIDFQTAALLDVKQSPESVERLEQIARAATRAMGLTRRLLAAGGQQYALLEPVDLNRLIRDVDELLRRLLGPTIVLEHVQASDLPCVLADRQLVEKILVNLVQNAREAMPGGGTLTLGTSAVRADIYQGETPEGAGEFIRLSIADTGSGMTPEVQAQLFEPFFSTRDYGRRLGLGLAGVYGMVRQHSGWIECTSEIGVGTEFRVFLPCAPKPAVVRRTDSIATARSAQETILLVEGDDRTRTLARCVLAWNGYRVIEADSSSLALLLWNSQASKVDLVLTSVSFATGLSGRELVERLRQTRPDLKVIFLADPDSRETIVAQHSRCVIRPCTPDRLLEEVRLALTRRR